jgi:HEPN domain-containing protein
LEQNGIPLSEEIRAAADLTDYSVEARYPGPFEPVTESEFKDALNIAESVVKWVESQISDSQINEEG